MQLTLPNILVEMWYPLITESIVIMIQPQIQLYTPLHVMILRDHVVMVIGYFADIMIADIRN